VSVDELIQPFADPGVAGFDPAGFDPAGFDPAGFDPAEFGLLRGAERDTALLAAEKLIRRLRVVQAQMIHTVARSGSYSDDAHHSPKAWVEAVLNLSSTTASRLVQTAALLDAVPALAAAAQAGSVGADQIDEIRKLYGNPTCRAELRAHGYRLVGHAKHLVFPDFRQVLMRWRAHVDPDGTRHDHLTSRQRRHVSFGTTGHQGVIHAEGDAASTEEMIDILRAHVESELLQDCEERRTRHGDQADRFALRRTHAQRCYDALQEIFRKAARTAIPGVTEPTVNIFTTETDLADAVRNFFTPDQTPSSANPPDPRTSDDASSHRPPTNPESEWEPAGRQRFCETEGGAPVDPADMVIAALTGKIRSVIVTNDGRYLHATNRQRLFTGKIRDMILLLGRHRCSRHGCGLAGPSIQIDHLESHACGGCTTASNGGPLCPIHNRAKHRLRFTVTHDQHGWHHHRPDGTEIAPRGS